MNLHTRIPEWHCFAGSVQGDIHKKIPLPNEDSIGTYQEQGGDLPVILSVADGLGSKKFFRAERGSRKAVESAIEIAKKMLSIFPPDQEWDTDLVRSHFCRVFVDNWVCLVKQDYLEDPPAEIDRRSNETFIDNYYGFPEGAEHDEFRENILSAFPYSTTSITLIATPTHIIVAQIGNGDVVMIESDGSVSRPFPDQGPDIGVETLAMPASWDLFKIQIRKINPEVYPAAIFVSTDGYSDSYSDNRDFERYITEIWTDFFKTYDPQTIHDGIIPVLEKLTKEGSGDDISLGILCDIPQLRNLELTYPVPGLREPLSPGASGSDERQVAALSRSPVSDPGRGKVKRNMRKSTIRKVVWYRKMKKDW